MPRYIDADELLTDKNQHYDWLSDEHYVRVRTIELMPTADVVERKKGKWIVTGTFDDFLKCSCCGYKKPWNEDVFDFCPKCGADMREEKTDETN